jgi:hypothetical protein
VQMTHSSGMGANASNDVSENAVKRKSDFREWSFHALRWIRSAKAGVWIVPDTHGHGTSKKSDLAKL